MAERKSNTPVICAIAEMMNGRTILQTRTLRDKKKVTFIYGLSDQTTIVATHPINRRFDRCAVYDETFEEVWKRLSKDISMGDMQ